MSRVRSQVFLFGLLSQKRFPQQKMVRLLLQVALHFVELYFSSEQQRIFDVQISANGQMTQALTNFDIYYAAGESVISGHNLSTVKPYGSSTVPNAPGGGILPHSIHNGMLEKQACP